MSRRTDRLGRLVDVQRQLKLLHETRNALHIAAAATAGAEASDLIRRFDGDGSLAPMFPDVYNRRISAAMNRETESLALASVEARHAAEARIRTGRVEHALRDERRREDRAADERDLLELLQRASGPK
jgi:hypothetical protein